MLTNPALPMGYLGMGPMVAERARGLRPRLRSRAASPPSTSTAVTVDGDDHPVTEAIVLNKPFGDLRRFTPRRPAADAPKLLIVAPMSGHYATLLRGTVARMVENAARSTSPTGPTPSWCRSSAGRFDLDDYIDYLIDFLELHRPAART